MKLSTATKVNGRHRLTGFVFGSLLALLGPGRLGADATVPALFSEHAVLQRSERTAVWGTADAGEKVSVRIHRAGFEAVADAAGNWEGCLDLTHEGDGPYTLMVKGRNTLTIDDVVIGDVWICSGQSNMQFKLREALDAKSEISRSANPMLRRFAVQLDSSARLKTECRGSWVVAGPETAAEFSAVAYYFGQALNRELGRPVGLVVAAWGGTPIEAWTSAAGLDTDPDLKHGKDLALAQVVDFPNRVRDYSGRFESWAAGNQRWDRPVSGAAPDSLPALPAGATTAGAWRRITLPGEFRPAGLDQPGAAWLCREVVVPREAANKDLVLEMGLPRDFDITYWNGVRVGETTHRGPTGNRRYTVPASLVKPGSNVVAMRVFSPGRPGAVAADRWLMPFHAGLVDLAGEWLIKSEYAFAIDPGAAAVYPIPPGNPPVLHLTATGLFNAMIHPLVRARIAGAIWYQGESNTGRAWQYRVAFPALIRDWRAHWRQGDFPFYFCVLANHKPKLDHPSEGIWAELRDAQIQTLALPNTGLANLIDLGETADVHPRNKKEVGERLARVALAKTYGRDCPHAGPRFESMQIEGDRIIIRFSNTDDGLVARRLPDTELLMSSPPATQPLVLPRRGSQLQGFTICGQDRIWHFADARIEEGAVVVWSPDVSKPAAVRYAWADNPTCNLYNGVGLPALPFRTDDFRLQTRDGKYGL